MTKPDRDLLVLIVATSEQAGKTTAAAECARLLGLPSASSSRPISAAVERKLGLAAGTIAAARAKDPEHYRRELIEEGDRMAAAGLTPGQACLREGYRIIDGIRRVAELEATCAEARAMGLRPLVICLSRPGLAARDNTEVAGLRSMADAHISNDGTLDDLRAKVAEVLRRHGALEGARSR
jgi:hypothetical protein